MSIRPEIIEKQRRGFIIFDDGGTLDHRGMTIRGACDVEATLVDRLATVLSHSKRVPVGTIKNGFESWSLSKLADLAFFVDVISNEDRHDIKKMQVLRNKYAHSKSAGNLERNDKLFKLVSDTFLFKSTSEVKTLSRQAAYLAVIQELTTRVQDSTTHIDAA